MSITMQRRPWKGLVRQMTAGQSALWKGLARRLGAGGCACALAAAMLFAAGMPEGMRVDAYGANDSSVIETLTVTFKASFGKAEEIPDPEITVSGTGVSLGDVQYRTEYDNWKPGRKVRAEITVLADEGKVFPTSLTRSKCKVTGADFVSAKALDNSTLQVKVDYKPIMVLGETEKAGWSNTSDTRAVWKSVEYAPGYSVTLYGDNKVAKRLTVETNSVDLAEYMKDTDKTYYYEVKAVPVTSDQKKYLKEGEVVSSTGQELEWDDSDDSSGSSSNGGRTSGDGGSVKGYNYILPDGSKAVNTWKKISGQWYYFDQNGNMARGWQNVGGFWYYMDQSGKMQHGWVTPDGAGATWYYLQESGEMRTGWIQPQPGIWYYLEPTGLMHRGWLQDGGKWYYMTYEGRTHTGWLQDGGSWRYFFADGSMAVNGVIDGWTIGADGIARQ